MIKFFRLSKHNFVKQNRMSCGHSVEIGACGLNTKKTSIHDKVF